MIRVSAIHPSFGRPEKAFHSYKEWMEKCAHPEDVEYIVGLDDNDPDVPLYKLMFNSEVSLFGRMEINVGDSRNIIAAVNRLATVISPSSELIVVAADDQFPCMCWDRELLSLLSGVDNFNVPKFIGVYDGVRGYNEALITLIVNRAWYTRLGYLLYPEYDGVFADNDMNEVAKKLDCIIHAPHLLFAHRHYSIGACEFDATYARNNNPQSRSRNEAIYFGRRSRGFDV